MKAKYFSFLRRLQAKGRSNMYGAVPYLMSAFGLDRERAFQVICEWLDRQKQELEVTPEPQLRHTERTKSPSTKRQKLSKLRT